MANPPTTTWSAVPDLDGTVDTPVVRGPHNLPSPLLLASSQPRINVERTADAVDDLSIAPHLSPPPAPLSPMRHHKRTPSQHRVVKETLDAKYTNDEIDGKSQHTVNQYEIGDEIGRGSYGAVHLATDQYGHEYAIKEFSKSRLRKRAQSNILRRLGPRTPHQRGPGMGLGSFYRNQMGHQEDAEAKDALYLIRAEIAIMKKLNHPNLVTLIEVLDDPENDSLYMVLEMCKKGVVMKIGLDQQANPYSSELCRTWFRDLILGIEYLHSQGIIHRDIKPDNLLLTDDDVLKIVDFGVSEMFERPNQMLTNKSAGSPAFIPPELCQVSHGDVSGKAVDVWSMGVTLYCLKYGKLPFNGSTVLDMYQAIREDPFSLPDDEDPDFVDLITRILDKDSNTRITLPDIRNHPWVTKNGHDPLLSEEENCSDMVETPNELEVNHAFTRKMDHLICVLKAIRRFKGLVSHSRVTTPRVMHRSKPPADEAKEEPPVSVRQKSVAEEAAELVEQRIAYLRSGLPLLPTGLEHELEKGTQDPDPVRKDTIFLGIGTGGDDEFITQSSTDVISESPTGIEFDVYSRAFESEMKRIRSDSKKNRSWTYITKHLGAEERSKYAGDDCMIIEAGRSLATSAYTHGSSLKSKVHSLMDEAGEKLEEHSGPVAAESEEGAWRAVGTAKETGSRLADLVASVTKEKRVGSTF